MTLSVYNGHGKAWWVKVRLIDNQIVQTHEDLLDYLGNDLEQAKVDWKDRSWTWQSN